MSACRQQHMLKFCNCTVGFLFPSGGQPECNITGLLCLVKYNEIFNAEKPLTKNPFFDDDEDGIECFCLPECSRIEFSTAMSPIYDEKLIDEDFVQLDIHFGSSTMMKYRTDVTFGWMDLVVGFGGILGLFFGCSLLSGVEFIYFSTIALLIHYRRSKGKLVARIRAKFPFTN
jgi:amiloride-sensitive sodium channel